MHKLLRLFADIRPLPVKIQRRLQGQPCIALGLSAGEYAPQLMQAIGNRVVVQVHQLGHLPLVAEADKPAFQRVQQFAPPPGLLAKIGAR